MSETRRGRKTREEVDAAVEGALAEEVFPDLDRTIAPGQLPEWLDPVVRVLLEEARTLPALEQLARGFDIQPEIVLAEAIAREVRREVAKRLPPSRARRESDHLDASYWSTLQLVKTLIEASEAAANARPQGKDASIQAAFDVLSAFSMPSRAEAPEIDLSGPLDACVKDSQRIWDAQSVPRAGRFNHTSFALDLAREHGCLVPGGRPGAAMESLRSAGRRYDEAAGVDPWVHIEETIRGLLRKKMAGRSSKKGP